VNNTATLTLTSQFVDRAHLLDADQWQRIAQSARHIHIGRILETVLVEWSFDDRLRAVGPQRRLLARHLGRWDTGLLPVASTAATRMDDIIAAPPASRVFGARSGQPENGPIDTAVLAALTAID